MASATMKLVEEYSGDGELLSCGESLRRVRYQVSRYQGMLDSGMPVPGLHRIEGRLELGPDGDAAAFVDRPLTLKLEDGRTLPVTVTDAGGRILSEGHGPGRGCACC